MRMKLRGRRREKGGRRGKGKEVWESGKRGGRSGGGRLVAASWGYYLLTLVHTKSLIAPAARVRSGKVEKQTKKDCAWPCYVQPTAWSTGLNGETE